MRFMVWLFRAFIFFTLFAFALNNQQEAGVKWFFGTEWRAPMVFIVLGAFGLGCAFGVFAMVPAWWKHRRVARRLTPAEPSFAADLPAPVDTTTVASPDHPPEMDFDFQWVLLALPVAFALGWMASRLDLRQWKREQRDSPRAYYKGLNLLLNEQHDKAVDAFIEAVQQDPDTSDLHFALGNLFRRRGEYERSVRVHEHLLNRADLPDADRQRAQHGLAQDFMKAGLLDRAESAWRALEGTAYDTEARLALLTLHERSRDWRAAVDDAQKLERSGTGSYASRVAHYWCELALEADARNQTSDADDAVRRAREAAPGAARPLVLAGERARAAGDHDLALQMFRLLLAAHPNSFSLVATAYADSAIANGEREYALTELQALHERSPSLDVLRAIDVLDPDPQAQHRRAAALLARHPTLSVARELLHLHNADDGSAANAELSSIEAAVGRAAKPLQRYRCAACGFEAHNYFWQCPGCLNWDSYPPLHMEDL